MRIMLKVKNKNETVGKCTLDNLTTHQIEKLLKYIRRLEIEIEKRNE